MTVINTDKDYEGQMLTMTAMFDAPVEQVWQLWADARQLEQWWGPPTYPATVTTHELSPGGEVAYYMTGPEGDRHYGWWKVMSANPPMSLEFNDGFADENGEPMKDQPTTTIRVVLSELDDGSTRMEMRSTFPTREQMEDLEKMGMVEGMQESMGQMDGLLK